MDKSSLIATSLTVLFILGLVAYRLLWAASSVAAAAGLGRFSKLPKGVPCAQLMAKIVFQFGIPRKMTA